MSLSEEPQVDEHTDSESELHCNCLNDTPFFRNPLFQSILADLATAEATK